MKYIYSFALLCIWLPLALEGADVGIKFDSGLSWSEIKAKAKAENKYIFVDCYATWCGPCKYMSREIFPRKEVGEYFNAHFINVAVQMDQTPNDSVEVRAWYAVAAEICREYKIDVYPTYLFSNADGLAVHRTTGAARDAEALIAAGKDALDPAKQSSLMPAEALKHRGDPSALLKALRGAETAGDEDAIRAIGDAYAACVGEAFTKEDIVLLAQVRYANTKSEVFQLFLKDALRINSLMADGGGKIYAPILDVLYTDEIVSQLNRTNHLAVRWNEVRDSLRRKYPTLGEELITKSQERFRARIAGDIGHAVKAAGEQPPDWEKVEAELVMKYPGYDCWPISLEAKANYFSKRKDWNPAAQATYTLLRQYGDQVSSRKTNDMIWNIIVLHCGDQQILLGSAEMMKRVVAAAPNDAVDLDTYANVLYKTGDRSEALRWERAAIAMLGEGKASRSGASYLKEMRANLDKMEKDQPTWADETPVPELQPALGTQR